MRTRLIGWALVAGACDAKGEDCPGASASPIVLETATGDLDGTLQLPAGCGPFAVVLIHAGSGPTDRDGNSPLLPGANDSLKQVAAGLAERGVASVRFDKRGVGASQTPVSEEGLRFEMLVDDAAAWVEKLAADERFTGVTIAGHSEGSLIGMLAAKQSPAAAFVAIAGLGRPAGEVIREQLSAQLSAVLFAEADAILDALEAGVEVDEVSPALYEAFRPSVQPYLISYLKYDPSVEVASLAIPTAIVQGTTDIQTSVKDAKLLAAAAPDAQLTIIEGMNHVLKAATLEPASQWAAYTDPSLPVVPALFDALVAGVAGAPSRARCGGEQTGEC
ncbi:alpha/beta hydrolase [Nannocystis pusilla]|uniref:Alpha/beta fold hydrolase n=1 Tax=Nannocystis pusilla TaxID=889268 RepID=A0ABS7TJF7_9BACT|nr:alpha/beta fold hydrolase [Nannocystis pusilla]